MSVPILTDAGLSVVSAANTSPVLTSVGGEEGIGHHRGFTERSIPTPSTRWPVPNRLRTLGAMFGSRGQ
jgi:hypothetical protein